MIEEKVIKVVTCDVCGVDDRKAQIGNRKYLCGMGYKPSKDDPLAQKFKKLYIRKDICDRCRKRMDHNFLSLSAEEHKDIVMSQLLEKDNRKDLRSDPRVQETDWRWPPYPFTIDPIDKIDKMDSGIQKPEFPPVYWPDASPRMDMIQTEPHIEERKFKYEGNITW